MGQVRYALIALMAMLATASAQERWPSKRITIVVPYSVGTAPDIIARLLGNNLSTRLGETIVIENKTGAGGLIGTEHAAGAKADGYTLFLGSLDSQAIIGHLYTKRKHDPATAFKPISLLARISNVVAASPASGINTFEEMVAASKAGRTFYFATPGVGTNLHLLGELINLRTGAKLNHVPYRSASEGYTDAMGGRVDLVIAGIPPIAPLLLDNKLKALVTTGVQRSGVLPDTPTMAETGFNDLAITGWFGLLAPIGVSPEIVSRLNEEVAAISKSEEYVKSMRLASIEPAISTPEEFGELIRIDSARMGEIVRSAGIKVD